MRREGFTARWSLLVLSDGELEFLHVELTWRKKGRNMSLITLLYQCIAFIHGMQEHQEQFLLEKYQSPY